MSNAFIAYDMCIRRQYLNALLGYTNHRAQATPVTRFEFDTIGWMVINDDLRPDAPVGLCADEEWR